MATTVSSTSSQLVPEKKMDEAERTINILVATFVGLDLPRTLSLPVSASTSIGDVYTLITKRLPSLDENLIISSVSNKQLLGSDSRPIQALLCSESDTLLSLRLSRRICGGKGGFGSQLRAAGGRMNSRKKRDRQNQNVNGSNRNLDGRRLRTIDQAKKLADYLTTKPEMDRKEKEERKQRWEAVVEAVNKREEEIRSGKAGANKGRINDEYLESKELAEEKTREAVLKSLREGTLQLERTGSESSMDEQAKSESEETAESSSSSTSTNPEKVSGSSGPKFFGWDDDEDEDDDSDEDVDLTHAEGDEKSMSYEGKGKGRVA